MSPSCRLLACQIAIPPIVTVRERDSMTQDRVPMDEVEAYLRERIEADPWA